ncbi:NADH-quinone oxidoreductase subunit M [Campylobacter upsaliensis]|nr:NADH-quinone oxidoreductase subunit M [Campylobacter upsaliensis]EAJ3001863.1 NADH-quinone oxidoreductase subunit M [Campylobacter upsaliensis]EAK7296143.1 NADH-quinone oxidoreductase subunit M [Campylobacter upsaliensis]EDP6863284.1 NADH-quinone oxidoreductase subunit M [Campylobacter upsaliensis]EDP6882955.1 NADH-quinone oxidoreductase subunit M [Campylobacter upsaliensis]
MLNILIFFPLLVAFLSFFLGRGGIKIFSVVASLLILGLNLQIFFDFLQGVSFESHFSLGFAKFFSFHIGVSAISLSLMLLCSLMIFLSFLFLKIENKAIVSAIFFLEFAMMGLFSAQDALLFYIFWEFSLLPLLYILGVYGKDFKAGIKFFIYAFAGSILMLVAILYQASLTQQVLGIFTFDLEIWKNNVSVTPLLEQIVLFLAFFIAFAIKAPLFPLHTWAPKVYANSPILVSVMLVAFKMAPFGFLQFCLPLFPDASVYLMPFVLVLCVISVVYCAMIAFKTRDLKELIVYSSISHIGIMVAGIFTFSTLGISGAVFYMFAHGLVTGTLFLLAHLLVKKYGTSELNKLHSLSLKAPGFAIFFALVLLASVSLPLTISFVGEFLVLLALAKINIFLALFAGLVVILGAIYMLAVFRKIFFMQKEGEIASFGLKMREILALIPVIALIFYLGIAPNILLKPLQDEAKSLQEMMHLRALEQKSVNFLVGGQDE